MAGAFTVMPMRQTIELVPGQTYTGYITVANPQVATEDFHYFATAVPYSVIGEDYQADFATRSNRTLMADWITIENPRGEVAPNGTEKIYYTIKVPESVPAGGQYAAIAVSSDTDMVARQGLNVQSVFEIASALYAVVDGETEHAGEVLENKVPGFMDMHLSKQQYLEHTVQSHVVSPPTHNSYPLGNLSYQIIQFPLSI